MEERNRIEQLTTVVRRMLSSVSAGVRCFQSAKHPGAAVLAS